VVSAAHTEADIERTGEVVEQALRVYRSALEDGIDQHLRGRSVRPVMRPYA
jgi:glutamate-1-semialdehyde 2,1-aminomutase